MSRCKCAVCGRDEEAESDFEQQEESPGGYHLLVGATLDAFPTCRRLPKTARVLHALQARVTPVERYVCSGCFHHVVPLLPGEAAVGGKLSRLELMLLELMD